MVDRKLRERAAQMVANERRYRFPFPIRCLLIGLSAGLIAAALVLSLTA